MIKVIPHSIKYFSKEEKNVFGKNIGSKSEPSKQTNSIERLNV